MHSASLTLSDEAQARLEQLEQLVNQTELDEAQHAQVQKLFNESRFAFKHALSSYADNDQARTGLERTLTMMVEYQLSRRAAEGATTSIAELAEISTPPAALAERVHQAREAKQHDDERLRQLEHDANLDFGARMRWRFVMWIAVAWGRGVYRVRCAHARW